MKEIDVFEPLPPIKIKIDCTPREFLNRMALIAEHRKFDVEKHYNAMGDEGFDVLNLRFSGESKHENLGGQLIAFPDESDYVSVEVRATHWYPETPPSYSIYAEEAERLFRPLLSEYNKEHRSNRRLYIIKREQLEPKLSPNCEKLFKRFTTLANTSILHPLDWNRFYEFVVHCRNRDRYSEEKIARLLMKEGFQQEYAKYIGSVYKHLCDFKHFF